MKHRIPLIAVIEDEQKLAAVLNDFLENAGYQTRLFFSGKGVTSWVNENQPDLLIIDLMLPDKDGLDITQEVRQISNVPIIITTARVEEIDRLLGLELGADDYVCKPYSPREVVARVKALLRRANIMDSAEQPVSSGLLQLEPERLKVRSAGGVQELTPVEYALLEAMFASPGRIFSRDKLMDRIYQDQRVVSDRTIDSHVKKLRRKLAQLVPDHELIHSVYGAGYRYEEAQPE